MAAPSTERVLTRNVGHPEARTVRGYRDRGGYRALAKAVAMERAAIIDEVKKSGLRGRGGAGFPAGMKWSFVPQDTGKPTYLVANADESEPGTFKDRLLMEHDPQQFIEGCAICCYAVGAHTCYVYIRGEYTDALRIMEEAIADAYREGVLGASMLGSGFALDLHMHVGAGAYICGEETGMLESLEGKRGQPRVKPPFPAVVGAFGCPTVINNVETLCCVPHIVERGADWFRAIGTDERNTGPKLYAVSGHVERPGTYEYPLGVTLRELIDGCGGMYRGGTLKAFIPGGASAAILTADQQDLPLDFDTLAKAGSMLGSAAVMVLDDTTCMVRAVARLAKFFAHESCGQCTPCREGTNWSRLLLARIEAGGGRAGDRELLLRLAGNMSGTALCALADAAVGPIRSLAERFPDEVEQHIREGRCPFPPPPLRPRSRPLMPIVTIDGRTIEVERGTNLIEAGLKVGVQIPHYCYHPRLSVVGQCRMCLVALEGNPKLQAACSVQVMKDGMTVRTDSPEVKAAQDGMMEFFLINHPLDCPICDQAGECGLQDYSFKHGQAFSRFDYEDKRIYPGRERIPLGPTVLLNMNRCIQCTRCIRFTEEISKTGELAFFERGAHVEIGNFPGKPLDNPLATNVVDICPVGALTSTRFRFAERVWYLDKKPSLCTGCDVGCNVSLEHRRGKIRRYKPRFNPEVNDYWMCDYGRETPERYAQLPRLSAPRVHQAGATWRGALDLVHRELTAPSAAGAVAFLASGQLSTEEAYLLAWIADRVGTPHRAVAAAPGPERTIPNLRGGIRGREAVPNRRGVELAGLAGGAAGKGHTADDLVAGDAAAECAVLVVADSDFGPAAHDPEAVARLRRAAFLVVLGWADTPLARAADVALPVATHAEKAGTFVNVEWRVQRFAAAFPPPGEVLPGVDLLADLAARFDPAWQGATPATVFDRLAAAVPAFAGLTHKTLPATGAVLDVAEAAS